MKKIISKMISAVTAVLAVASSVCMGFAYAEVTPNPVISRNCPSYSGTGDAKSANDEHYFSFCFMNAPDYIAYDLSAIPDEQKKQVIAVWYNTSSFDNIGSFVNSNMKPTDYTVEVNKADGGEYPTDNWEIIETVTGNVLASCQHLVNMEGYNWIRLNIAKADGQEGKTASINFDVHSVSNGISDSWLFLGDSITAGGMNNCYGTGFATHINQIDNKYFPIQENGGIGGIRSIDGKENIDRWLSVSQAKYVSIAYGTNDCWGNPNATQEYYENTKYMIDAVIEAGKIPVLPKIPASTNTDVKDNVPLYNAVIDKIYDEYGDKIVQGVDFEAFFTEHPDYLSGDGVHPNDTGYAEMRKLWAETMYERVYSAESKQPVTKNILGDIDNNGIVDARDASLIFQEYYKTSKGESTSLNDLQLKACDVNEDGVIDIFDAFWVKDYYNAKLNGSTVSLKAFITKEDDGINVPVYKNNPANEFSEEEIANSKRKPAFALTAEQTDEKTINLAIDISGAPYCWSTIGFTLNYDKRLAPVMNGSILRTKWGEAVGSLSHTAEINDNGNQIAISTIGKSDMGTNGNIVNISFKIPEDAKSTDEYKFSINCKGGELFTDIKDSESAKIMQAYLFTKGLDETTVKVCSDVEVKLIGDANNDGSVDLADATAIIQHIGNIGRYRLSEQGEINADCNGDGIITGADAIAIQKLEAKQIDKLPYKE